MQTFNQNIKSQQTSEYSKNIIFIDNLDKAITEDYLFHQLKQFGDVSKIKVKKDHHTQKSCGQAFITFSDEASAEKARLALDNQVLISNIIKVKPYLNISKVDKDANVYMKNLPKFVKIEELEQEFSKYGNILSIDIRRDDKGNQLNYGYIQFSEKSSAQIFLEQMQINSFKYQGNEIKFELFKTLSERSQESSELFLRGFSYPIPDYLIQNELNIIAIEYGWQIVIQDYFEKLQDNQILSCFTKIERNSKQPWAIIQFETSKQAKDHYNICEKTRTHPCIQSSIHRVIELINIRASIQDSFSEMKLSYEEIISIYDGLMNSKLDIFSGASENFYFNLKQMKNSVIDERQLYIQNINSHIKENDLKAILSKFGVVISINMRQSKKPHLQKQDCIVLYQTTEDAKRVMSSIYDIEHSEMVKYIFKDGIIMISVFLSKNMRMEYQQVKKKKFQIAYMPMKHQKFVPVKFQPQHHMIQNQQKISQQIPPILNLIQKFNNISVIKDQMENFLNLSKPDQRTILGTLLFPKVIKVVVNENQAKHIVGMIIDPSQFELTDIFELFENDMELQDIISEGLQLIKENQK